MRTPPRLRNAYTPRRFLLHECKRCGGALEEMGREGSYVLLRCLNCGAADKAAKVRVA